MKSIYVIGSLKSEHVVSVSKELKSLGYDVFCDWISAGPDADDYLRDFYRELGLNYREIMSSYAARHIYGFDKHHLDRCDAALLVMPAGKSAHLELGYTIGRGKPGFILFDEEPERVDIMHGFAFENNGNIFLNRSEAIEFFKNLRVVADSPAESRSEYDKYWGRLALGEGVRNDEPWVD